MRLRFAALVLFSLSAQMGFAQAQYLPVNLFFPQVAVGGDANGQNYVTLIQMVNNNSVDITGHIALFGDSGSPLSALFDGDGPKATMDVSLTSGQARQIQVTLAGAITAGWMQITYTPSDALTTVILQFRSGTTLLSEVGVDPAFDTILGTDFAAETDVTLNTGIAIANPISATAYVLARLWDPATGTQLSSTPLTLPASGHLAKLITELFPSVLNIGQMRVQVSLDSCSSSSCTFSGGNGLLATAIRLNADQFTTIPVSERNSAGDATRILPQVAFGGPPTGINMKTVLYLTTNVGTGVFGTADVFDNDGNPLLVSADGGAPSSSISFTVSSHRVSRVVLSGDATLRSGWIRLTNGSGAVNLTVSAVFQTFNGATLASEASVLESPATKGGLIYVRTQPATSNVGVAFANAGTDPITITLDLFTNQGDLVRSSDIALPPNGHLAKFLTELFSGVPDFNGSLSIRSAGTFSALALRLSFDKIATLPVAPDGMFRPSITGVRITGTQRSPAQVNFSIDVVDNNSDIATSSATSVSAIAQVTFDGTTIYDFGSITLDGTILLNRQNGTLSGFFQPRVTGIPSGQPATFYLLFYDSAGNPSNVVTIPFKF